MGYSNEAMTDLRQNNGDPIQDIHERNSSGIGLV